VRHPDVPLARARRARAWLLPVEERHRQLRFLQQLVGDVQADDARADLGFFWRGGGARLGSLLQVVLPLLLFKRRSVPGGAQQPEELVRLAAWMLQTPPDYSPLQHRPRSAQRLRQLTPLEGRAVPATAAAAPAAPLPLAVAAACQRGRPHRERV
jgi:hypothetical protein